MTQTHPPQSLDIVFASDARSTLEAMQLAGREVYRGRGLFLAIAIYLMQAIILPVGCLALFLLGWRMAFGANPESVLVVPAVYLLGAAFGVWVNRAVLVRLAVRTANSRFGKAGRMQCTAEGVTLTTDASIWQTGWTDISGVYLGKSTISFAVSGVALILPLSAFADKSAMAQAHEVCRGWWQDALRAQQDGTG